MPERSNSRPMSRSIQGKAFSWPMATSTSSQGMWTSGSPVGTRVRRPLVVVARRHLLEEHAGEAAGLVGEGLGRQEVVDGDAFVHGILLLPGRRLHLLEAAAHDDLHLLAAEAPRGAAAIHGGVAAAEHDDALADLVDVAERDARQPVDADMDAGGGLAPAGDVEVAAARRAGADEDGVVALGQQGLEAVDPLAQAWRHAHVRGCSRPPRR